MSLQSLLCLCVAMETCLSISICIAMEPMAPTLIFALVVATPGDAHLECTSVSNLIAFVSYLCAVVDGCYLAVVVNLFHLGGHC